MKLYLVKLRGMTYDTTGTIYGLPYVVAENPDKALAIVKEYLQRKDIGFRYEREMDSIGLLAEEGDYPKCKHQLFIQQPD